MKRLARAFGCTLLVFSACRQAEFENDLRIAVTPRVLNDDGSRARVAISASDAYGQPARGHVLVQSTAGSLKQGLELVLGADGSVITELRCEARQDPGCVDQVTVHAEWVEGSPKPSKSVTVAIHTTDAFASACAFENRRVLKQLTGTSPVAQLVVLDDEPEVARFSGSGVALWDPKSGAGAFVATLPSPGATVSDDEASMRSLILDTGTIGNPLVQTFTTWDGYAAARSTFDYASAADAKAALDAVARALTGAPTGLLGVAGKPGPFKAALQVVRHDLAQTAVVFALTPAAGFDEARAFDLEDLAGGTALALADDAFVDHCDVFTVEPGKKVDFFWVVDDSCSMESSQTAVAAVGATAGGRIASAQLDFRSAGVTTGFYGPDYFGSYRTWTSSLGLMLSWFRGPGAWGIYGTGYEAGFAGLRAYVEREHGIETLPLASTVFRPDSEIQIIFLSDTRDQSPWSVDDMLGWFAVKFPKQHVVVHAIACPEGSTCGDESETIPGKYHELVRRTGGVLGSIRVFNPLAPTAAQQAQQLETMNAIVRGIISGAGYSLGDKPITASVRVAASTTAHPRCNNRDIPRSTTNGWDLDPLTGRMAFYGDCVPTLGGTMVVSYKSWKRFGTGVTVLTNSVHATVLPGPVDAGTVDAGTVDAGVMDAGS